MALPIRHTADDRAEVDRWDPFDELERLNRQLASYLGSWPPLAGPGGGFRPLADVEEADDAYVVEVELPGVKRDDVDIQVTGRRVTVHGERKEKERAGILRRRERTVGRFDYELTLPGEIDEEGVEADLDEGVLTLRLPKPAHDRPRRIPIR
ncbi:MAG TPA: Hsp20/alpha crystallin family protein [Acidimicrobiales bacterium]|nr:Hsp20/alpha crystallin family protein [Acidimicrobiales bacterium]